tara:strand:+ start:9157 stop:9744 length:588 start_codon:yes stop_codon:yes gene_type:complete
MVSFGPMGAVRNFLCPFAFFWWFPNRRSIGLPGPPETWTFSCRPFRPRGSHTPAHLQGTSGIYAQEELPIQVAVEPLHELSVGAADITLKEHQGDLAPGGVYGHGPPFRLYQPEGRRDVAPGDRPIDLAEIGPEETVVKMSNCSSWEENEKVCWKSRITPIMDIDYLDKTPEITNANRAIPILKISTVVRFLMFS